MRTRHTVTRTRFYVYCLSVCACLAGERRDVYIVPAMQSYMKPCCLCHAETLIVHHDLGVVLQRRNVLGCLTHNQFLDKDSVQGVFINEVRVCVYVCVRTVPHTVSNRTGTKQNMHFLQRGHDWRFVCVCACVCVCVCAQVLGTHAVHCLLTFMVRGQEDLVVAFQVRSPSQ